jgi:NADH dehydrogenase
MKNILIVGASGVLGHAAAEHFLQKGYRVTAFVRDPGKVRDLESLGARVVKGDLTDPASCKPALEGADVVITAAHALMGKGKNSSESVDLRGHQQLIDGAKAAGVRHFIYTSAEFASADAALDFSRTKYAVENYLLHSGVPCTILRPTAFMEWHAYRLLGQKILESGKVSILGNGKARVNFIAVQDVVLAIERMIDAGPQADRIIELCGPETISRNEVAERFGKAYGKPFNVSHVPIGMVRFLRAVMKPFHPGLARVMEFTILTEDQDSQVDLSHTVAQFGLRPTMLDEFISQKIRKS